MNNQNTLYIYGKHSVIQALENPKRGCIILHCTRNVLDEIKDLIDSPKIQKKRITVRIVEKKFLDNMIGEDKNHQGLCLLAKKLEEISIYDFVAKVRNKERVVIACLDQVLDPHNIGAILRNAAAFGINGIIMTRHHSPEESGVIAKVASGALDIVPIIIVTNLAQTIDMLKKEDFFCYGMTSNHENKDIINDVKFHNRSAIVLGAEHAGLRRLTQDKIDKAIYIPIKNIDSLNVSSSSAIAFFYATNG